MTTRVLVRALDLKSYEMVKRLQDLGRAIGVERVEGILAYPLLMDATEHIRAQDEFIRKQQDRIEMLESEALKTFVALCGGH